MGFRTSAGFLAGGLLLLAAAPRLPDPSAPQRYIWPGIGFLLGSGLTLMALNWRMLVDSVRSLLQLKVPGAEGDEILSRRGLALFAAGVLFVTFVFSMGVMGLGFLPVVALVLLGGLVQNLIATRAAAVANFNPARVMGALLQGVCAAFGARSAALNLTGAGFVAGSGAQASVLTGDMVYGRWFKVPPRWQFWTQMMTILPCSVVSAAVFRTLNARTPLALEGAGLAAPVAKIWATTALIFDGQRPFPPYALEALVLAGVVGALYVALEEKAPFGKWLPSSMGLGIGLVLPVSIDLSFFVGGFVLAVVLGRWLKISSVALTTLAVAAIVGEGLGGVLKPLLDVAGLIPH
jgi:OPT oligopeptide transporter protein